MTGPLQQCERRYGTCQGILVMLIYQKVLQKLFTGNVMTDAYVQDDKAAVWRGPMVMSAIDTFINKVNWGALDVMVIDMPPGTGDAQLSISQRLRLSGAVMVSTPQASHANRSCSPASMTSARGTILPTYPSACEWPLEKPSSASPSALACLARSWSLHHRQAL